VGAINPAYSIGFSSDIVEPAGWPLSHLHRASTNARIPPAAISNTRAAKKWPIGQKNDGPDRVEVFLRRRGLFIESTALNHFFGAV